MGSKLKSLNGRFRVNSKNKKESLVMRPKLTLKIFFVLSSFWMEGATLHAGEEVIPPANQFWSWESPHGVFDRGELQRGFQVFKEVCAACHGVHLLRFEKLAALGYNSAEIKAIANEYEIKDGPNDEGEMFVRKGLPSDHVPKPYPNVQAARAANNGAAPPDLSLIVKARKYGPDYLYSLLTGYQEQPPGFEMSDGMYYNRAFEGFQIAMPAPLADGGVTYADGTTASVAQMARDVTAFLAWAAEPELEERKQMGWKVLFFLIFFTGILFALMKRIWSRVK